MNNNTKVILVDANEEVRAELRKSFEKLHEIEVVDEAASAQEAMDKLQLHGANVIAYSDNVTPNDRQIFLKDGDKSYLVKLSDIYLIESVGNYSRFYFASDTCLMHRSLKHIGEQLSPTTFFRANRKQIINLNFIDDVNAYYRGGIKVTLVTGRTVEMSNRSAVKFKSIRKI